MANNDPLSVLIRDAVRDAVAELIPNAGGDSRLLVTFKEAAEKLDCSEKHIVNLVARGEMRQVRLGASRRIEMSELRRYIKEHTSAA